MHATTLRSQPGAADAPTMNTASILPADDPVVLALIDGLPMNAVILDRTGEIRAANASWRQFAADNGGDPDACGCGANYLDVCAKADAVRAPEAEKVAAAIRSVAAGQGECVLTYPCHSETEERWFRLRVASLDAALHGALLVTHEDITAATIAAREVEIHRSDLQMLLDTALDAVHVTDEHGRLKYFSHSFARILGYRMDEMPLLRASDWELPGESVPFAEEFARLKSDTGVVAKVFRRKNGSHIHVEVNEKSIVLDGLRYLYRSARDVTDLLRDERQKARDRQHLEELERVNRELDEFAYVASHDLRSPLRAISSLSQWILEDDRVLEPVTRERVEQIQTRARRMTLLLDSILLYARAAKTEEAAGDRTTAHELVKVVVDVLHVPKGFSVHLDPSLDGVPVRTIPLQQVLHNVIGNALKHHDRSDGVVRVAVDSNGARYRFVVSDDGPGIPEKYRESVFGMFTTLKPRDEVEGSGMGLALVRKLVQRLGGECGILSADGGGTHFWFDWPRLAD